MKLQRLKISKNGYILHSGFEVDPIFYSLKNVSWQVFLSLHFKGIEYTSDSVNAEKNRQKAISEMVWGARKQLGLAHNDLIHVANSEKQNDRCHIHALVISKERARVDSEGLLDAIKANAYWHILSFPSDSSAKNAFQPVRDSVAAAAYYSKRNKNDMDVRSEYISPLARSFLRLHANTQLSFL